MLRPKRRGRGLSAFAAGSRASHSSDDPLLRLCTAARACALRAAAPRLSCTALSGLVPLDQGREIRCQACSRVVRGVLGGEWAIRVRTQLAACKTLAIAETEVCDILVAIPSSFNSVSVTTELLTTGLVGPLRSLSANSREQEYEQAATSCSHCNSLIQHAPLRYR